MVECPRGKTKWEQIPHKHTQAEIPDFGLAQAHPGAWNAADFGSRRELPTFFRSWEQEGTHHVLQVFWFEGGQLQLQLTQALETIQEILEKNSGLIHQEPGKAIWGGQS